MSRIAASIGDLVGNTPLFEPVRVEQRLGIRAHLLCKLEGHNPAGSSKDRAALSMLQAAEEAGILHPGDTIVEQTSGNTGIALAAMAVPKGYHCDIFLEAGVTRERKQILLALGCHLLTRGDIPGISKKEIQAHPFQEATLEEIRAYCRSMGPSFHFLDQTTNPNNPLAHVRTTGPEIWRDTDGKVDALVLMAGTGGTLRGLSQYLRKRNPKIRILTAEPAPCSRRCAKNPNCQIIDGVQTSMSIRTTRPRTLSPTTSMTSVFLSAPKRQTRPRGLSQGPRVFSLAPPGQRRLLPPSGSPKSRNMPARTSLSSSRTGAESTSPPRSTGSEAFAFSSPC